MSQLFFAKSWYIRELWTRKGKRGRSGASSSNAWPLVTNFFALGGKHVFIVSPMDMQADGGRYHIKAVGAERRHLISESGKRIGKPLERNLKIRLLLDKFSVELFINDGVQTFTSVFYTPLEAEEIVFSCDGTAKINIEQYRIELD